MKLEIELDLNKIDYDAINEQIAEKIAQLDIKEMRDIDSRIDNRITKLINDEVDRSYSTYIDKYWHAPTSEGRDLIQRMSRQEIEARLTKVLDDIFAKEYSEDVLRETMLKVMPNVFTNIMFSRLENALFTKEYNYREEIYSVVRGEIENRIHRF